MHTVTNIYQTLRESGLTCSGTWFSRMAYSSLLLACSCSSQQTESDTAGSASSECCDGDSPCTECVTAEEDTYMADYDIAMTIRSVADAINVGEPIDSTDYNFSGVLTDGMGSPLFTDFDGFPGQWEVDVITPNEVKIRNIGTGDLMPGSLMEYLASALNASHPKDTELRLEEAYDKGETRVEIYSYGQATLKVETRPELLPTGEVGPKLEITLHCDTLD